MTITSVELAAATPDEVGPAAARCSLDNPGKYIIVTVDFGMVTAHISSRLGTFATTDSWGDHYWLNGKAKPFTNSQRAADWAASPTMT